MVILQTAIHWAPSLFGLLRQLPQEAQARIQTIASQPQTTDNKSQSNEENQSKDVASSTSTSTSHQAQSTEYLVHNWLDAVFSWLQVVVLWHDPVVSLQAITGILITFLTLTYFAPSFYATIAIAFFIYNLIVVWFRHIWPEIRIPPDNEEAKRLDVDRWTYLHPQLISLSELNRALTDIKHVIVKHYYEDLSKLRQREPIKFCCTVCSILIATAYIGNHISGLNLLFIIITLLVATPGIYLYIIPKKFKKHLIEFFLSYDTNCEYCIRNFTVKQQHEQQHEEEEVEDHNLDHARAHQQQHHQPTRHNHIISLISESLFQRKATSPAAAQNEEVVGPSKPPTIDQIMSYIARGPSSRVQPQETILESTEECDHSTSCDNVKSQPENKVQRKQSHNIDDEEQKSSDGFSSKGSISLIDSEDEQVDDFVML